MRYRKLSGLMALGGAFLLVGSTGASAVPESCGEFTKLITPRIALIQKLNNFKNKKPTAAEACNVMTGLVQVDKKIMDWMVANKDWCQVPDEQLAQLKQSADQSSGFKSKACAAAVTQAKQIEQLKRAQAQGAGSAPPPGSGVRLPQGAL